MFTVVVYEKRTRKVILCLSLEFENEAFITQQDAILHSKYEYEVFANRDPVFYEDADGDICLKANSCIINGGDLL